MNIQETLKKLNGLQTIESIKSRLHVDSTKAIYLVHRLRKKGYVKTRKDSANKRIYVITRDNVLGGVSYIDIINKYSPIKLASSEVYKIYGRDVSIEETVVYAIKTRRIRYILASLALFKKIKDWKELYRLAKKNDVVREIGALYDVVEHAFPRVKKMSKYFLHLSLPKKQDKYRYIVENLKSNDSKEIEKKWKVYIPINKEDLAEYKR